MRKTTDGMESTTRDSNVEACVGQNEGLEQGGVMYKKKGTGLVQNTWKFG